jgi:hypothetical protein
MPVSSKLKEHLVRSEVVAHTFNPRYSESGDERIVIRGQPGPKNKESASKKKTGLVVTPVTPAIGEKM